MKIGISADSTCDLPQELADKYDIRMNAMPFSLGERLCHDKVDGTSEDVFKYVEETGTLPTTSAFNAFEYKQHFENILKDYDAVIHFSFSSEISSTANNARMAAEELENVYVIDSLNASVGISLLVMECVDRVNQGMKIHQIVEEVKALVPKVHLSFVVDTLKFLHKGGRCSSLALLGANLLKIKPRISLVDGKMQVTKKYRGRTEDALVAYFEELIKEVPPQTKRAFVISTSPISTEEYIKNRMKEIGFKEVYSAQAGPSICIHCGKRTLGVAYLAE